MSGFEGDYAISGIKKSGKTPCFVGRAVSYPAFDGFFNIRGIHRGGIREGVFQFDTISCLLAGVCGPVNLGDSHIPPAALFSRAVPDSSWLHNCPYGRHNRLAGGIQGSG